MENYYNVCYKVYIGVIQGLCRHKEQKMETII